MGSFKIPQGIWRMASQRYLQQNDRSVSIGSINPRHLLQNLSTTYIVYIIYHWIADARNVLKNMHTYACTHTHTHTHTYTYIYMYDSKVQTPVKISISS